MSNSLIIISLINREVINLFRASNVFVSNIDFQYEEEILIKLLSTKEVAVLGTAVIIAKNPIISRRLLGLFGL